MGRCKYCGGEVLWRDNAGWYRDFCRPCATAIADGQDLTASFDPEGEPVDDPDRPDVEV